ncbi:MAG: nucleoside triphosphate pyrophosphohydrolase family protein [bacterium]|nr:nucleoside triphosphate pyrophosphohydrolase family protein [bacterium]
MDFQEYQKQVKKTSIFPEDGHAFVYATLGLSGETGEVAEKVKKIIVNKNGVISEESKEEIKKELGDVLWYLSQLATELDLSLEEIAEENMRKIHDRMKRGVLKGNGDNR